jgi:hypothetical protein
MCWSPTPIYNRFWFWILMLPLGLLAIGLFLVIVTA